MKVVWFDPSQDCATVNPAEIFLTENTDVLAATLGIPRQSVVIIQEMVRQGDTLPDVLRKLNSIAPPDSEA